MKKINKIWNAAVTTPKAIAKKTKEVATKFGKNWKEHNAFMEHELKEVRKFGGREVSYNPFSKKDKERKRKFLENYNR